MNVLMRRFQETLRGSTGKDTWRYRFNKGTINIYVW